MTEQQWQRAWAAKERADAERESYEVNLAWAAWRLFTNKYLIIILLVLAGAWWFGLI